MASSTKKRHHQKKPNRLNQQIILSTFKTEPCATEDEHNHKQCHMYHNGKDRRRVGDHYSAKLCNSVVKGTTCPYRDQCKMSHNCVEQLFRPEKFKTKFCSFYPQNLDECEYGSFCCFAHSEEEISIPLIHNYSYDEDFYLFHFKTIWCPFNLSFHDKALCVYAHNWQDFRRKPSEFHYEPIICPNWNLKDFINIYSDGCPNSNSCKFSHGWKELEYHPLTFKSKACKLKKKCRDSKGCPNYHSLNEKREIPITIQYSILKFVPRNRIVTGVFKKKFGFDYSNRVLLTRDNLSHYYTSKSFHTDESKNTIESNEALANNSELISTKKRNSLKATFEELAVIKENFRRKSICTPTNLNDVKTVRFDIIRSTKALQIADEKEEEFSFEEGEVSASESSWSRNEEKE